MLRIECTSEQVNKIEIYDVYGRNIYLYPRSLVHSSTASIDISHLQSGIYLVKLETDKGAVAKKFVKE